jgi:hypothetical protein
VTPKLNYARFTSDINAFAIGVRSVRPDARILLVTKDVLPNDLATCERGVQTAASMGADVVLTPHYESLSLPEMPYSAFSVLMSVDPAGRPVRYLAAPDWNWERFYIAIVKSYLNGSLNALLNGDRDESPITSFWWGLGGGVVNVRLGSWSSGTPNNLLRYLKAALRATSIIRFTARSPITKGRFVSLRTATRRQRISSKCAIWPSESKTSNSKARCAQKRTAGRSGTLTQTNEPPAAAYAVKETYAKEKSADFRHPPFASAARRIRAVCPRDLRQPLPHQQRRAAPHRMTRSRKLDVPFFRLFTNGHSHSKPRFEAFGLGGGRSSPRRLRSSPPRTPSCAAGWNPCSATWSGSSSTPPGSKIASRRERARFCRYTFTATPATWPPSNALRKSTA